MKKQNIDVYCEEIEVERRPCFVGDEKAWFHRWIDKYTPILKVNAHLDYEAMFKIKQRFEFDSIIPPYCDLTMSRITLALVEYENGTVAEVEPTSIRFDNEYLEIIVNHELLPEK